MSLSSTQPIGVWNEWGKLREVLVGNAAQMVFPRWSPDWGRYHGQKEALAGLEGRTWKDVAPENTAGQIEQTNTLAKALEGCGVVVHRPRALSVGDMAAGPVVGYAGQWCRDPRVVIGKHVIETNLRNMCRNKEHLAFDRTFASRVEQDPDARHVRMPAVSPDLPGKTEAEFLADPRPFIEGGDTFVLGKDILVGVSSLASSPAGIAWLQRYLGPEGYRVHAVPLTADWLHLDCMFAVVREGLCVCYMGGLKDGGLPEPIKNWDVIEATAEEAHALGCNTICLEPNVVVIGAEHGRLIKEIEKRGARTLTVPFEQPSRWGGGIRCSTHPLARDL